MPSILTSPEAAVALRFDRKTVCRLCEEGRLVGAYRTRLGGHWRIPMSALDAFRAATRPFVRTKIGRAGQTGQIGKIAS
jgi:excisionase family DNA binding protein